MEVLNRLENDEDNLHAESGWILINCQLQTSRQNSQQSQGRQQGNRNQ